MAEALVDSDEQLAQVLEWRVHPLTESFWRSVLLVFIIACALYGVWAWTNYPGLVLIGAVFLLVSMAPYLLPTTYRMSSEGIEIRFLGVRTFREWEQFRNFYPHDVGVHLSTFSRPSGLDAFRGSFIRFAPDNREAVLRFLNAHIKREKVPSGESVPER